MRITQIITRSELRGAEVVAAQLSSHLTMRGHQVALAAVYAPLHSGPLEPETHPDVLRVELQGRKKGRIELGVLKRLSQHLREFQPDIVQANAFHALKHAVIIKSLTRARWKLVYRNISVASSWFQGSWKRRWGRWLFRHVDFATSVSDSSANDLVKTYQFPATKIITIPRGVEIPETLHPAERHAQLREMLNCPPGTDFLFHIGGFTPEKNHRGLLQAFSQIHAQHPQTRLILCGDGPLRPEIEQQAQQMGLSNQVHFLGNRPDARELLEAAKLLLLTSDIEGIPGVILEAAARKIPVVSTDAGAVHDFVLNQQTGVIVPVGDMGQVSAQACTLLQDIHYQEQITSEAFKMVCSRHSMNGMVEKCEEVFETLIDQREKLEAATKAF